MAGHASQTTSTPDTGSISTQASSVYDRLQTDILTGKLRPGHKLRLKDLIKHYDTGNSPLREALNRLSANGMVVREENRGFRVPPASADQLGEITRTRCWLEEIALRESIKNGDSDWEERIVLAFHWLARTAHRIDEASKSTSPEWEQHHREFHLALISACNSSILIDFCAELHQRAFRYRNLAEVVEYRDRHELEEHEELQWAVLRRDADKAVELLRKHHTVTAELLVETGHFD
ncbi:MAG: FCD domain-containing protein [Woeseiaceae bacterium]|nr:FCD domain-containing protein [Woeseiaceae bacterium]NIP21129.1 FCD domain-containing protein [Woeseiaceae bacterium]NIS90101.1 FCD domain-containing protein [Woeseiaceae bacterium]